MPGLNNQRRLCKQAHCFAGRQRREKRRFQEVVSVTQKAHKHSEKSNKPRQLPKKMFYTELFNIMTEVNSLLSKK
jgi:hypothetical protein